MAGERLPAEPGSFDVSTEWERELGTLQAKVDEAYEFRVEVSVKIVLEWIGQGKKVSEVNPPHAQNGVWVENPHLYPHLLRFAFQKVGLRGQKLQDAINETFKHETQHLVPIIGSPDIHSRLGIQFFQVAPFPFLIFYQAELKNSGTIILNEEIDIATNVSRMSAGDKADLKKALKAKSHKQ